MSRYEERIVDRAEAFAAGAHLGQKYGLGEPYSTHLSHAVSVLHSFLPMTVNEKSFAELVAATYLHDTLEDTKATWDDLDSHFGAYIAQVVEAVTDKPGVNRRARHEATYPGIREFGLDAITVKLADRIANVEYSRRTQDSGKTKMYTKEYPFFRSTLYRNSDPSHIQKMWEHLDHLLDYKEGV